MSARPIPPFEYMEWAKERSPGPRFNLAQSGAPSLSPADEHSPGAQAGQTNLRQMPYKHRPVICIASCGGPRNRIWPEEVSEDHSHNGQGK